MKKLRQIQLLILLSITLITGFFTPETFAADSASYDTLLKSTVRIKYERRENGSLITGHGTAFGVDLSQFGYQGKRYLLTVAHNVLDATDHPYATLSIEMDLGNKKYWSPCKVAAFDKSMDICLVEAQEELPQVMQLDNTEAGPGIPIVLAGSPRGIPVTLYYGDVIRCFEGGSVRTSAKIEFDHGDSGGPVVNTKSGKIAGIAVAGFPKDGDLDHTRGMFVPLMAVNNFLQTNQRGTSIASMPVITIATVQASSEKKSEAVSKPIVFNSDEDEVVVITRKPTVTPKVEAAPLAKAIAPAPLRVEVASAALAKVPLVPTKIQASHIVVSGDTLSMIARKYGTTTQELQRVNEIKNVNFITVGTRLNLPSNP